MSSAVRRRPFASSTICLAHNARGAPSRKTSATTSIVLTNLAAQTVPSPNSRHSAPALDKFDFCHLKNYSDAVNKYSARPD